VKPLYGTAVLEWPILFAELAAFGSSAFIFLAPREMRTAACRAMLPWWRVLAMVMVVISPLAVLNTTAEMAGVPWHRALGLWPEVLSQTHAGHMWRGILALAVLLLTFGLLRVTPELAGAALLYLTPVLLYLQALMGHAIDHGNLAIAIYFVHELAAGLWLGSLMAFWFISRSGSVLSEWIPLAGRRLSAIALTAVSALLLTGAYNAWYGLDFRLANLWASCYGRTLIAKLAAFALVLALGGYNRFRILPVLDTPRGADSLRLSVGIEALLLGVIVVGLTSLLAVTSPAHGGHMTMTALGNR